MVKPHSQCARRAKPLGVVAVALAVGAFTAQPSSAGEATAAPFGYKIWKGAADSTQSRGACTMVGRYGKGRRLSFSYGDDGLSLSIGFTPWKLADGESHKLALSVDRRWKMSPRVAVHRLGSGDAWAADVPVGDGDDVLTAFKRGHVLLVRSKRGTAKFPLTGTLVALDKLKRCYAVEAAAALQRRKRAAADPFGTWGKPISLR